MLDAWNKPNQSEISTQRENDIPTPYRHLADVSILVTFESV